MIGKFWSNLFNQTIKRKTDIDLVSLSDEDLEVSLYSHTDSSIHRKFVIPVNGLTPEKGQEEISKLISDYKEEIVWNDETGEVSINSHKDIPYGKSIWLPNKNNNNNE